MPHTELKSNYRQLSKKEQYERAYRAVRVLMPALKMEVYEDDRAAMLAEFWANQGAMGNTAWVDWFTREVNNQTGQMWLHGWRSMSRLRKFCQAQGVDMLDKYLSLPF